MADLPPPARFVQGLIDAETRPVPAALRATSTVDHGDDDIPRHRYVSQRYHDLEMERMWPRVWQMACREEQIAEVGDHVVYEIGDFSLIVTRTGPDRIQAFHNSCLHRGTQLRTSSGRVEQFRCPFHGFTWNLDGTLREIPCAWDFPHVDPASFCLPEARTGTWGGFVFINLDTAAPPLDEYLELLPEHFRDWPLEERYATAHVVRVVPCNWKVALEAFIESYHTVAVHPQLLRTTGDTLTEYDVWPDSRHISRMITPVGVASEHLDRAVPDDEILGAMFMTRGTDTALPEGASARDVLAERSRQLLESRAGRPFDITDCEAIDAIEYFVFPNFMPWPTFTTPLVYRFRPHGHDPNTSVIDVMLLEPVPSAGPRPPAARPRVLGPDETWADAPELGFLGRILNQDNATLGRVQRGLRASPKPGVTLAHYQESRIRHFHETLGHYVGE
ncbi:MAG TPA: aromatic ring-hydroxylating dioxygenase subunit alpha [Acidimicrobiales bacterium]